MMILFRSQVFKIVGQNAFWGGNNNKFRFLFHTHMTGSVFRSSRPIPPVRIPTGAVASNKQRAVKGRRKSIETVKKPRLVVAVAVSGGHHDGSTKRSRCHRWTGLTTILLLLSSAAATGPHHRRGSINILVTTGPPPTPTRGGHHRGNRGDGHSSDNQAPCPTGSATVRYRSSLATRTRPCFPPCRRRIDVTTFAITIIMIPMVTHIIIIIIIKTTMNAVRAVCTIRLYYSVDFYTIFLHCD